MKKQRNWKPQIVPLVFILLICAVLFTSCFDRNDTPTETPTPNDSTATGNESGSSEGSDTGNNQTEPHVHEWSEWTVTTEPTCTEEGEESRTCTCGEIETQPVVAIGHVYNSTVTAPTCTAKGYTTYTCSCGDSYVGDYVDATGHSFGEWKTTNEATCTENGEQERSCACGERETQSIDATGHTNGEWITDADATCTENGSKHQVCSVCEATIKTESIAATGQG